MTIKVSLEADAGGLFLNFPQYASGTDVGQLAQLIAEALKVSSRRVVSTPLEEMHGVGADLILYWDGYFTELRPHRAAACTVDIHHVLAHLMDSESFSSV